ncbi:hypothetical protein A3197_01680 [Candidatus Thiodiazotropha endoloripes]|nr:hypothetical protein A3197_01680 [Candidatus Thiodiazotropha endoloripes]
MDNDDTNDSNIIELNPNGDLSIIAEKRSRIRRQAKRDRDVAAYLPADEILLMISDSFEDWAEHLENLNKEDLVEYEDITLVIEYMRYMKKNFREWLCD